MGTSKKIIPIFVPHKGCPHDCVFCNQKKIAGQIKDVTTIEIEETINKFLKTIPLSTKEIEVAFFGGSFTGIDVEQQEEFLNIVYNYKKRGLIDKIRLSTRPDYINNSILALLKKYDVDIIELGVQSLDEEVLVKSNRGHTINDVINAVNLIKSWDFEIGLQFMIGLPGDTKEKAINTALNIIKLKPSFVRLYPTLVIKGTYLEYMHFIGKYKPLTLEEAIDICTDILILFNYYKIPVIRIGLQPTENISLEGDVLSGPYHPSIRQLIESNIYKIILEEFVKENEIKDVSMLIEINSKLVSNLVGQKSSNVKYFKDRYNIIIKPRKSELPLEILKMYVDGMCYEVFVKKYMEKYLKRKGFTLVK
ncbi:radical SAM protein [Caloranaerobacter sp. TR13]|uniref:elongator complex protein 3 n=1 Tax=Caloranaerobacter sp. TR13 TaxID=1302151 RepID=UPI0006D3B257|nr:radical SAM protein [Caloranaerobacter sp. TR13]KPU28244.1 radical SAM protein [Caloranaerobacter sp. TR13]